MALWIKLIPQAISLVEMAGRILASNKKEKAKTEIEPNLSLEPSFLLNRIEILENNELKQAELIEQMALQNLSLIKKAEKNYTLAIIGICISVVSLVAIVLLFIFKM